MCRTDEDVDFLQDHHNEHFTGPVPDTSCLCLISLSGFNSQTKNDAQGIYTIVSALAIIYKTLYMPVTDIFLIKHF